MTRRTKITEEKRKPARRRKPRRRTAKVAGSANERKAARTPRAKPAVQRPEDRMSLPSIAAGRAKMRLLTAAARVLRGTRHVLERLRGFREEDSGV